ncbi:MAG TPA: hypothetical protein PKA64_01400 [Myxococcota bacterium]|nr:hypothetical protein [Myxococcota bacterium]
MRVLLLLLVACGGDAPSASPPMPPQPKLPADEGPKPMVFDGPPCAAKIEKGEEIGVWSADLEGGNQLDVHVHRAPGVDPAAPLGPGLQVVAWGELRLTGVEALLGLPVTEVPDPGSICVGTHKPDGSAWVGSVVKSPRSDRTAELSLVGELSPAWASHLWGAGALQPVISGEGNRLVPGFDRPAGGGSYVLLHVGDLGPHASLPVLENNQRITGDGQVSLVNRDGAALSRTIHMW